MKLFGQIVRTVVNTVALPVAALKDLGEVAEGNKPRHVKDKLEDLKEEAGEEG